MIQGLENMPNEDWLRNLFKSFQFEKQNTQWGNVIVKFTYKKKKLLGR